MIKINFKGVTLAVAMVMQGCVSQKIVDEEALQYLTKIKSEYGYVTPQEIEGENPVAVAIINVDFSRTHILFEFDIGTFEPRKNRGDLYLKVTGSGKLIGSLAELRAAMEPHILTMPIGIIMMVDGAPLGVGGHTPKPEQNDFFRDFAAMMSSAGIQYAYIVPEKITLSR